MASKLRWAYLSACYLHKLHRVHEGVQYPPNKSESSPPAILCFLSSFIIPYHKQKKQRLNSPCLNLSRLLHHPIHIQPIPLRGITHKHMGVSMIPICFIDTLPFSSYNQRKSNSMFSITLRRIIYVLFKDSWAVAGRKTHLHQRRIRQYPISHQRNR